MSKVTTQENKYKVTCRTKGAIKNWWKTVSAPDKNTAFFRMADILEERGMSQQTIIISIRKVKTETQAHRWARCHS